MHVSVGLAVIAAATAAVAHFLLFNAFSLVFIKLNCQQVNCQIVIKTEIHESSGARGSKSVAVLKS